MQTLGQRLRVLREEEGLSREKAAAAVHITSRTLQRYENDEREPTASIILALARYFGVTTDYLLGNSEEELPP